MFSDPVVGEGFFGRQEIIELLSKRASALKSGYRQNVAIIGHQQLGKTSILRHFLHTFKDPQILPIYVEIKLQALDYFVEQFSRSLLFECLKDKENIQALEPLSELNKKAASFIPKTVASIDEILKLLKQRHPEQAYSKLFELTSIVKYETGKHCIVVLDEFHRLGEFGIKNAFSDFGKRIMVQKDTMYLLSSSAFSASKKILAEKLSLLFGNFERIYLEPFDFDTSFDFLEKKLAPLEVPFGLKYFLVAFTDGHPFFLETIAARLKELALAKSESALSKTTVAEVLLKLLFESQGVFYQFFLKSISPWTSSGSQGAPILVLTQLAKGVNKLKDISKAVNRSQEETSRCVQELVERELILKNGVFYRFHNKIFKFWIREVYERKELSLLGVAARLEDFTRRVEDLIAEYEELLKIEPQERILSLFSRFQNEIVEFGEKRRQLPHFTEFIPVSKESQNLKGSARGLIAKGHGRCWVCKVVEEKATEKEVLELLSGNQDKKSSSTRVLVALKGVDENAKLLAKEKKVLTLSLSRINMLMDVYGHSPMIPVAK